MAGQISVFLRGLVRMSAAADILDIKFTSSLQPFRGDQAKMYRTEFQSIVNISL